MLFGAVLLTALATAIILFLLQYNRRQRIHQLEKAALQHTFDNQLLQSRLEVQEQSFQYFSEEIHDNVGQVLSVIGMHLYQLDSVCKEEQAVTLVRQSSELLNKVIGDLRSISHTLNSQYIGKAGLLETLRKEIAYVNSLKYVACTMQVSGEPVALSADREILLFRILQEALNNALKHAKATVISIRLDYAADAIAAAVNDNGRGFNTATVDAAKSGIGLTNMQIRAGLLGGTMLVQSEPGRGTTLSLSITVYPTCQTQANAPAN